MEKCRMMGMSVVVYALNGCLYTCVPCGSGSTKSRQLGGKNIEQLRCLLQVFLVVPCPLWTWTSSLDPQQVHVLQRLLYVCLPMEGCSFNPPPTKSICGDRDGPLP